MVECALKVRKNTLHPLPMLLARVATEAAKLPNGISKVGTRSEHEIH